MPVWGLQCFFSLPLHVLSETDVLSSGRMLYEFMMSSLAMSHLEAVSAMAHLEPFPLPSLQCPPHPTFQHSHDIAGEALGCQFCVPVKKTTTHTHTLTHTKKQNIKLYIYKRQYFSKLADWFLKFAAVLSLGSWSTWYKARKRIWLWW